MPSKPARRATIGVNPPSNQPGRIQFGPFQVDLRGGQLLRGQTSIPLRPKTWAVLLHLVERAGVLVTKDELLDKVWQDVAVTPDVLNKSIGELREALGDDRRAPRFIETVQRRGFRFAAVAPEAAKRGSHATPPFVGRLNELRQLTTALAEAQVSERQIVFITGPAGIGKTALVDAFLDSAAVRQASPWIARATCIEQQGQREPYMPVLTALDRLTRRPDPEPILRLLRRNAPAWLVQLPWLVDPADVDALRASLPNVQTTRMLREFAALLEAFTRDVTLVLVLEDLHWCDPSTVDLLSFLAQRSGPMRLLVIGTYRPAQVAVSEHPLGGAVREMQIHRQCTEAPLSELSEDGVRSYLEARFPGSNVPRTLARRIHAHTDGAPLFMVASVDYILSRGWIVDTAPGWALTAPVASMDLGVPDDVRRMIESQFQRSTPAECSLLEAASVAEPDIVGPVVAAALGCDVGDAERRCEISARPQRFLRRAGSVDWPDGVSMCRYSFSHELYRQVVYERIPEGRRALLHQRTGEALEGAYGARALEISPRLAHHFERGRDRRRALHYMKAAGVLARQRYANREAISTFESALGWAQHLPDSEERSRLELDLLIELGAALAATHGFTSEHVRENYDRAAKLCSIVGTSAQHFSVLYARWYLHSLRGDRDEAISIAAQLSDLARRTETAEHAVVADSVLVRTATWDARFGDARIAMESLLERQRQLGTTSIPVGFGMDPVIAATMHDAMARWFLGDVVGARETAEAGLARARESGNPFFLCGALIERALVDLLGRRREGAELARQGAAIAAEQGFAYWHAIGSALSGWAKVQRGYPAKGSVEIQRARNIMRAAGAGFFSAFVCAFLAEGCLAAGMRDRGLRAVDEGLALAEATLDRAYEPELWRLKGELLLLSATPVGGSRRRNRRAAGDPFWEQAESCLERAIGVARESQAKSLELSAVISLACQLRVRGRTQEARTMLADICSWFDGLSDTPDLARARTLLTELTAAR